MEQYDVDKTVINSNAPEATQMVSQPQAAVTQMAMTVECPVCRTPNSSTETYCSDCGFLLGSSPVEVEVFEVQGPTARLKAPDGREFVLGAGVNTVGRVDSDVLVPDPTVSRKHAEVEFREGAWWLTDLGSTNGTFIDNVQLQANEPTQLISGAVIKFGTAAMIFEASEAQPVETQASAEATIVVESQVEAVEGEEAETIEDALETVEVEATPVDVTTESLAEPVEAEAEVVEPEVVEPETPALVGKLVNMTDPSANYPLVSGVNKIGRSSENSIQITGDPYVSGRHAEIRYEEDKFILIDVGSTNGTLLNGQPIPKQEPLDLNPGDEIGVGQGRYKLEA